MSLERNEERVVEGTEGLLHKPTVETLLQPEKHCPVDLITHQHNMDVDTLLKPACDEIKAQLRRLKQRLLNDYREADATLQAAKKRRNDLGDLLSQLQDTKYHQEQKNANLDCALQDFETFENEASKELAVLQREGEAEAALTALKRARIESLQLELGRLTLKLHHSEGLKAQEISELATTQRAAWCADDRARRQLLQNRQGDVIIQQLRTNIELIKKCAASDHAAADLDGKERQVKLSELKATEGEMAGVKKEAKLLHSRWDNALLKLLKVDVELADVVSKREETEKKIAVAKREATKLREEQCIEYEHNWKRGHAVNQALDRSQETENRILIAKEHLDEVLEAQKATEAATAETVAKLQQHEAARKDAERHIEELLIQKQRITAAYDTLETKFSNLLEADCEVESSLQATQQELRTAKIATVEKTAQIADLETDILKLQAALQVCQRKLEAINTNVDQAEIDVHADLMHLEAIQQQIDGVLHTLEQRTRELQLLNMRKQEREEAEQKDNCTDTLNAEIQRLRKELSATEDGRRAAQANWSQAQERLLVNSQRHFQLTQTLADAEKKSKETSTTHNRVLESIKESEMDILQLKKKLESLQKEISQLDFGLNDMSKLETIIENDLTSQQTQHSTKLNALRIACRSKETKIVTALNRYTKASTDTTTVDIRLKEIAAQKKAQSIQIEENKKVLKGGNKKANELHGQAAGLRRKLSAVHKRRNTAAVLLQKAAVASAIDNSDRYIK
ncbi:hypothetical protein NADE_008913 [Nannochloris sp. 'desiccata']|nr:hypothetical protein NADE_008913 [Chlorella desiccata (nom. nud.)]